MAFLVDTGILLRLVHRTDPLREQVLRAVATLKRRGEILHSSSQNIAEFWNVCTRPAAARGGYGAPVEFADRRAKLIEELFPILPDAPAVHAEWRRLALEFRVSGAQVHDARLVALMKVYRVECILTLNKADFARYSHIKVFEPADVLDDESLLES